MSQSLEDEEIYKIVDPAKRLLAALEHGFMTDYEICIGDERFACHINIVTLVSPKFASMLIKKKEQLIAWLAADPLHRHLFRLLLQIIYGRERTTGTEDTKTVLQLGYLAHKMQVPMALNYCALSCDEYNKVDENLWLMIQFAQDVDHESLLSSIKLAFNYNLRRILQAENFSVYTKNRLKTILRRQKLFGVTELKLFQACVSWANAKEDEAESRRAALRKVLPWIRFRLFSVKDFAKHVSPTGLLSAEQERDILRSCALGKNFMPHGFSKCRIKRGYCTRKADSIERGISEQTDEASPESGDSVKENVVASDAAYVIDVPDLPSDEDDEEMSNSGAEEIAKFLNDKIRFWAARNNNVLTDTTIIVGSEEFKCHSFIVSCSSPKLAALLRKRKPAQLPNVDARHFRRLLEIIYTGAVCMRDDLKTLLQVGHLAFDLQVPTAFKYCAVVFGYGNRVKIEFFFEIFDFAKLINDAQLMHSCLKTIQNEAPCIFQTNGFLTCSASVLEVILKQDTIYNVTELQVFQACLAWSNGKPNEVESRRAALRPLLRHIRFRLFSTVDFAKHVCPTGLLNAEQERDILRSCATGEDLMPEGFSKSTSSRNSV